MRYSAIALGTDQARLMFPALAAMAVWVGVGLVGLVDWIVGERANGKLEEKGRDVRIVGVFTAAMATFGLVVLVGLIQPGFTPPEPVAAAGSQPSEIVARFGDGLALTGVELPTSPLAVGQPVPLRLTWWARQPLTEDLRPTLRLRHQDGWQAAEWSHSPAGGRYSTDRWQAGEVIADDYLLAPNPASAGIYVVELGVRPFNGDWLTTSGPGANGPFVTLGQVEVR